MLFWILLVASIVFIVWNIMDNDDHIFVMFMACILGLLVLFCGISICLDHIGKDAILAEYEKQYESLIYQYENNIYDNDNDLGKRELMVEIQEWNMNLVHKQKVQKDFWIGIFYPNIYDQLKLINY